MYTDTECNKIAMDLRQKFPEINFYVNRAGTIGAIGKEKEMQKAIWEGKIIIPDLEIVKREVEISKIKDRVDFLCEDINDDSVKVYLEVKPWTLKISDMERIFKYYIHLSEREACFRLIILCAQLDNKRRKILEKLDIKILFWKDILL